MQPDKQQIHPRLDRGAWITLLILFFLLLWSGVFALYYFSLPTDGWITKPPADFGVLKGYVYVDNLLGLSSGLQPGDFVIGIDGISLAEAQDLQALRDKWQARNTLLYSVRHSGNTLDVPVRLGQWQAVPALKYWIQQSGNGISLAGRMIFMAIAALAFIKRPRDHAAQTLFFFSSLIIVLNTPISIAISSPVSSVFTLIGVIGILFVVIAYTVLFPPTLLRLALVFPHPKPVVERHPWLEYLPYLIGAAMVPLFVLTNGDAGYAWMFLALVGTIIILIHSAFTMRDTVSRSQLLWGLWGFVLGIFMFLSGSLTGFGIVTGPLVDVLNGLQSLSYSVLGITLAIAVLRYRLFDIDVIIRRTLIYGVMTGLLVLLYLGLVTILQRVLSMVTGPQPDLTIIISTLAIAALFVPLRNRVQRIIDHRFYRRKYNAAQVLATFAAAVRDEVDLGRLTDKLQTVVEDTMQPEHLSLWLKKTPSRAGSEDGRRKRRES